MAEFVLADSGVVTRLTSVSDASAAYAAWLGSRILTINFQVEAELAGITDLGARRMARLRALLDHIVVLPHSPATSYWYSRVAAVRRELQRSHAPGGNAGDGDMWVISSALEHELPLMAHDHAFVALARALAVPTFTQLPDLVADNPT